MKKKIVTYLEPRTSKGFLVSGSGVILWDLAKWATETAVQLAVTFGVMTQDEIHGNHEAFSVESLGNALELQDTRDVKYLNVKRKASTQAIEGGRITTSPHKHPRGLLMGDPNEEADPRFKNPRQWNIDSVSVWDFYSGLIHPEFHIEEVSQLPRPSFCVLDPDGVEFMMVEGETQTVRRLDWPVFYGMRSDKILSPADIETQSNAAVEYARGRRTGSILFGFPVDMETLCQDLQTESEFREDPILQAIPMTESTAAINLDQCVEIYTPIKSMGLPTLGCPAKSRTDQTTPFDPSRNVDAEIGAM